MHDALCPAPGRINVLGARRCGRSHRTTYVCGLITIDRFVAFALQRSANVRSNGCVAAAGACRATTWRRFSSRVRLASSAHLRPPEGFEKRRATTADMMNSQMVVESLGPSELRSATHQLVRRSHGLEVALLVHLGEIDERKLYLDWSFSSMFGYCVGELGFSEDVACNRISLARAARRMPSILDVVRSGRVHLAGLRLLAPHLTAANKDEVLAEAAGKSKRQIEEVVARLAPQPPVPTIVRKVRTVAIPRRIQPHCHSALPSRWRRPSRHLRSYHQRRTRPRRAEMNAGQTLRR